MVLVPRCVKLVCIIREALLTDLTDSADEVCAETVFHGGRKSTVIYTVYCQFAATKQNGDSKIL